jgi:carbon monoxide dehydrogenase subunit G
MKFSGELVVNAPREAVFDKLKDAQFFASCVEGVRDLKEVSPTTYTANFETKIAYIKFKFEVLVEMTRADRPQAIEAKIEGKPHGIVGRLSATSAANFVEKDGGTAIQYAIEASLTGRLGSIGQPVLKSKAKEMERQFVQNLRNGLNTTVKEAAP